MAIEYTVIALMLMAALYCLWGVVQPSVMRQQLLALLEIPNLRYGQAISRLIVAGLFILVAPSSRSPIFIQIMAGLTLLKAVGGLVMSIEAQRASLDRLSDNQLRLFMLVGILFAGGIVYVIGLELPTF